MDSSKNSDTQFLVWFGLDVSKDSFTAAAYNSLDRKVLCPDEKQFAMDRDGVRCFLKWRRKVVGEIAGGACGISSGIAMEATGSSSAELAELVLKADRLAHVAVCNPCQISHYIRSFTDQKEDHTDAEYIARFGFDRQPEEWRRPPEEVARIRELAMQRNKYVSIRAALTNRGYTLKCKDAVKSNRKVIECLEKEIASLTDRMADIAGSNADIRSEVELMTTVPGIGALSAVVIYGLLGSLRQYTRRQLSALSGLSPSKRQSGKTLDTSRMSKRGPGSLRQLLFLDSTSATGGIRALVELRTRILAQENSTRMRAKCACMRKLLLIARAVVVSGKAFDPNHKSVHPANKIEEIPKKCEKTA